MPRGQATVDATVNTTTDTAVFQSDRHARANGVASGITAPGDGAPCRAVRIDCPTGSAATVRVRIVPGHPTGQYAFIKAGEAKEIVEMHAEGIDAVYVSAASGTATFNFTVIA